MSETTETVIAEARAGIAAGRPLDLEAMRARLGGDPAALARLEQVLAVHRARTRLARPAAPPPRPPARPALRTKPTVSANMDVRRDGASALAWDAVPAVSEWEVRFSERADARSDYEVRETVTLPPSATGVEVPLGDLPLRVHVLGRSRSGRLLRRAVVSGLTRDSWDERWQRRASAS